MSERVKNKKGLSLIEILFVVSIAALVMGMMASLNLSVLQSFHTGSTFLEIHGGHNEGFLSSDKFYMTGWINSSALICRRPDDHFCRSALSRPFCFNF